MNSKEVFYLAMAAIGGYAAWLQIKKYQSQQQSAITGTNGNYVGIFDDAFAGGSVDFYGQNTWVDGMDPNKFYGV